MKPLFACLAMALQPISAQASTDLARQWGLEASRLSAETSEILYAADQGQALDVSDTYAVDVYRFARTSADLARWIDTAHGSYDLSCLFRIMAEQSEDQLMALETPSDPYEQRESLRRLAATFSDAERIAIAAQRRAPTRVRTDVERSSTACEANRGRAAAALR